MQISLIRLVIHRFIKPTPILGVFLLASLWGMPLLAQPKPLTPPTTAPKKTTTTKPVRMSSSLIKKLEAAKGAKFTEAQRQQLDIATQKMQNNLLPSHNKYLERIAQITGVRIDQARESAPKPGKSGSVDKLILNLHQVSGRAANKQQRDAIIIADQQRKRAVLAVQDEYAKEIAKITALPVDQVRSLLPKVGL